MTHLLPKARTATESAPRVLLLDGHADFRAEIEGCLVAGGLHLESPNDPRRGLARVFDGGCDLTILGAALSDPDGLAILRQVRRRSLVPIILLTDHAAAEARVSGLDAGADDVLSRPFTPAELLARVRSILRRAGIYRESEAGVTEAGGVRVAPGTREAWAAGARLEITSTEYEILEYLVRAAGRVVSRAELIAILYQRPAMAIDRSLDVHISRLRKKLGPLGARILTVRGVGYFFQPEPDSPEVP